jgi:hypothetical protein
MDSHRDSLWFSRVDWGRRLCDAIEAAREGKIKLRRYA